MWFICTPTSYNWTVKVTEVKTYNLLKNDPCNSYYQFVLAFRILAFLLHEICYKHTHALTKEYSSEINLCGKYMWFLMFRRVQIDCPTVTHGPLSGGLTAFLQFWPKGHREPRDKFESLSPIKRPVGFELGSFWFKCNALSH